MLRWLTVTGSNDTELLAPASSDTGFVPTDSPFISSVSGNPDTAASA